MEERKIPAIFCIIRTLLVIFLFFTSFTGHCYAWGWQEDYLTVVNGEKSSSEDFQVWWQNWREKDMNFPESADSFVDWQLMVQEARRMGLDNTPSYRKKILTFLKVRSLLLLNNEEVYSKIQLSDDDLYQHYLKEYVPLRNVDIYYFKSPQAAELAYKKLIENPKNREDILVDSTEKGELQREQNQWLRPVVLDEEWQNILNGLDVGQFSKPFVFNEIIAICRLVVENKADMADFSSHKDMLARKLKKTLQHKYTAELVKRLKKKYDVKVDYELVKSLSLTNPDISKLNVPLIEMDGETITVGMFLAGAMREIEFRRSSGFQKKDDVATKKRVLAGIISQTLTTKEAIAREYQKREGLSPIYDFYCGHRMIRELEKRVIGHAPKATEEEITAYYQQNLQLYSHPDTVVIGFLDEDKRLLDEIWHDVLQGEKFLVAMQRYFKRPLEVERKPVTDLDDQLRNVVSGLLKGEVSAPMQIDTGSRMVYLVERQSSKPIPLEKIKQEIITAVDRQNQLALRQDFVAKLRERSKVKVNQLAWQKVASEGETL
jgi:hypothetical protein